MGNNKSKKGNNSHNHQNAIPNFCLVIFTILPPKCNGTLDFNSLKEKDFCLEIDQKGVDMKIGLDIASLAYKKQVDQIVLISGDSDFVSAAKLARREGIDFILDPLGAPIKPDLFEHIDGLRTCDKSYTTNTCK